LSSLILSALHFSNVRRGILLGDSQKKDIYMRQSKTWSPTEKQIVFNGYSADKTYREISDTLAAAGSDRTAEAVRKLVSRSVPKTNKRSVHSVANPYLSDKLADKYQKSIADLMDFRDTLVKTTTDRFMRIGNPVHPTHKLLTISDLHIPFINRYAVEDAITNHSDAQTLVINGDIFDAYLVSTWPKDKQILLQWEYQIAIKWIEFFAEIFQNVILVCGNHDNRVQKYFASRLDPVVNFLTSSDMLDKLAKGYDFTEDGDLEKVHDFKNVHYDSGVTKWYTIVGKTVFVHPLKGFSTQLGVTSVKWAEYFQDREAHQCMVMAHTHKQFHGFRKGRLLLEQGCCCLPMEYEAAGYGRMDGQIFGYATIEMDDAGNVDFDESKTHYIGTGSPIKTSDPLRFV